MMSFDRPVRLLLADSQPVFLIGLRACLAQHLNIDIVGEALSASHLSGVIADLSPDIALVSTNLYGVPILESLLTNRPGQRFIALDDELDAGRARKMIALGARGYVLKQSPGSVFVTAITAVMRGSKYVDGHTMAPIAGKRSLSGLTDREQEILRLIALGFSIREAAERIGIATKSAETYKARASQKLGIEGRRKIVLYGIAQGWFS